VSEAVIPGDQARVTVLVALDPAVCFEVFTGEIDRWWRRGRAYRVMGKGGGVMHLEPGVGGRLFEAEERAGGTHVIETGRVRVWEPPSRLVIAWRAVNFGPADVTTEVDVRFDPSPSGTRVTLVHRGWAGIRPDHPVRHGQDVVPFIGSMGRWWGELLSSLREHARDRS
jgi:uncharacterized protein YndB with AHSA1/START domain